LFIIVLALTLAGLDQAPLSGASVFSSNGIGCSAAKMRNKCEGMNKDACCIRIAAAEKTSCCVVSGLPVQQSPFVLPAPTVAPAPIAAALLVSDIPPVRTVPPDILRHDFSPPVSQSRLSIFLI
jgi:hypothetical protein